MAQPHAVIIGGGVGGLTAAVALHDRGWAVTVCEPSTSPGAVDTGLGILPNGLRVLRALGVGEAFHAAAAWPPTVELRRADGRVLLRLEQERLTRRYGAAVAVVSRSALLRLLAARLPAGAIHVGVTVTELHVGDIHQRAHVRTTAGDLAADLVVAADGVHSRMRALLFPRHPEPTYAGFTTWRFLTPAPVHAVPAGETWGSGASFGVLPLPDGRAYCYATATAPAGQRSADERAELLRLFGSWHDPIPALVRAVPAQAVVRADAWVADDPLPAYHSGRVALVGDAAHVIHPIAGQGLNLGLKDVAALAEVVVDALRLGLDPGSPPVLARYQAWRRFDTASMAMVTDGMNRLFSNDSAPLRALRDVGLGLVERAGPVKSALIRAASGLDAHGPKLLSGLPL